MPQVGAVGRFRHRTQTTLRCRRHVALGPLRETRDRRPRLRRTFRDGVRFWEFVRGGPPSPRPNCRNSKDDKDGGSAQNSWSER